MKKSLGLGRGLDALIDTTHIATAGDPRLSHPGVFRQEDEHPFPRL